MFASKARLRQGRKEFLSPVVTQCLCMVCATTNSGVWTSGLWNTDGAMSTCVPLNSGISISCEGASGDWDEEGKISWGLKWGLSMAIEPGCRLLAQRSLTIVLYFLLICFCFNFFSCGVICSFLAVYFAAYNSRRLLFICAFCSGDIAALRALSSSRLHSFGHVTKLSMEGDAFTAPIY